MDSPIVKFAGDDTSRSGSSRPVTPPLGIPRGHLVSGLIKPRVTQAVVLKCGLDGPDVPIGELTDYINRKLISGWEGKRYEEETDESPQAELDRLWNVKPKLKKRSTISENDSLPLPEIRQHKTSLGKTAGPAPQESSGTTLIEAIRARRRAGSTVTGLDENAQMARFQDNPGLESCGVTGPRQGGRLRGAPARRNTFHINTIPKGADSGPLETKALLGQLGNNAESNDEKAAGPVNFTGMSRRLTRLSMLPGGSSLANGTAEALGYSDSGHNSTNRPEWDTHETRSLGGPKQPPIQQSSAGPPRMISDRLVAPAQNETKLHSPSGPPQGLGSRPRRLPKKSRSLYVPQGSAVESDLSSHGVKIQDPTWTPDLEMASSSMSESAGSPLKTMTTRPMPSAMSLLSYSPGENTLPPLATSSTKQASHYTIGRRGGGIDEARSIGMMQSRQLI